jgi:hypothetical protein
MFSEIKKIINTICNHEGNTMHVCLTNRGQTTCITKFGYVQQASQKQNSCDVQSTTIMLELPLFGPQKTTKSLGPCPWKEETTKRNFVCCN